MSGKSRPWQIEEWIQIDAAADLSCTDNVTVVLYEHKTETAKGIGEFCSELFHFNLRSRLLCGDDIISLILPPRQQIKSSIEL